MKNRASKRREKFGFIFLYSFYNKQRNTVKSLNATKTRRLKVSQKIEIPFVALSLGGKKL
ncbi:hypothetical protein A2V82_14250 [candidate division KSB1 bacterium RBG_16_48_16]|nr:MAG: hypothetical protein A2V82_14250 [candidate division KSB1 bacterium RBG_16_48_16]